MQKWTYFYAVEVLFASCALDVGNLRYDWCFDYVWCLWQTFVSNSIELWYSVELAPGLSLSKSAHFDCGSALLSQESREHRLDANFPFVRPNSVSFDSAPDQPFYRAIWLVYNAYENKLFRCHVSTLSSLSKAVYRWTQVNRKGWDLRFSARNLELKLLDRCNKKQKWLHSATAWRAT